MCVHPYLLPEQQSRAQDTQDTQEADEAKEQELLGRLGGLSVACVWEDGREVEGLVTPPPTNSQTLNPRPPLRTRALRGPQACTCPEVRMPTPGWAEPPVLAA